MNSSAPAALPAVSTLFSRRVLIWLLLASGAMVPAGLWLRPVHLQWFDPSHFAPIAASMQMWIWSFRILVFGLFLRAAALSALGAFPWRDDVRALLTAGVTICVLSSVVS